MVICWRSQNVGKNVLLSWFECQPFNGTTEIDAFNTQVTLFPFAWSNRIYIFLIKVITGIYILVAYIDASSGTIHVSNQWHKLHVLALSTGRDSTWFKHRFNMESWSVFAKSTKFASDGLLTSLYKATWETNENDNDFFCEIFVMKMRIYALCIPTLPVMAEEYGK